ncbi:S-layer homology domain-containing protein [Alteribacillus bidgolensis]|uniref:S-layer homology domain-containing protein n=1 Tax=Alteribacillus bidgolensis TaxID=930129 RepID=A0A1G8JEI0_9BACI|nr:S-layer homology domain-containing protein [Alteribacillus bidgolensis]SDI29451.1 S-layer homology domain-containing protein [Alteribacillus bidgolensis]
MIQIRKWAISAFIAAILAPAAANADSHPFTDVNSQFWAEEEIEFLVDEKVVTGYGDGTFRPNDPVKRSQAASMLVEALELETEDRPKPDFIDIQEDFHAFDVAAAMQDEGIIRGKDGYFLPNEAMTRGQMAAVLNRSFPISAGPEAVKTFKDIEESHTFYSDIQAIAEARITTGYEDNAFGSNDILTRAQFSVFLARALAPEQFIDEVEHDTYANSRFDFEVTHPADWPAGEEAANGDGKLLYESEENQIRAYATHYMKDQAPDISEYRSIILDNGNGYYKETENNNKVEFDMFRLKNDIEYHVSGEVSLSFFEENEQDIKETILSFEVMDDVVNEEAEAKAAADDVIGALKNKNSERFASFVHPDKGVRFSPYAYVDPENDQHFSAEETEGLFEEDTEYLWGHYDGSGHPIEQDFSSYYEEFIYDRNFANAEETSVNERIGQGNTIDNSQDVYPEAFVVEYYFSGDEEEYAGMDWKSLRIAVDKHKGEWYVVGVIHDEWTI